MKRFQGYNQGGKARSAARNNPTQDGALRFRVPREGWPANQTAMHGMSDGTRKRGQPKRQ